MKASLMVMLRACSRCLERLRAAKYNITAESEMDDEEIERIRQDVGPALYDACPNILYIEEVTPTQRVANKAKEYVNYFEENIASTEDYTFEMQSIIAAIFYYGKLTAPLDWKILMKHFSEAFEALANQEE
jgi:hypothetical protein